MGRGLFQPMHLLIILAVVIFIFGPGKLPEIGNAIGKAIRGFKKSISEPEAKPEADATKPQNKE